MAFAIDTDEEKKTSTKSMVKKGFELRPPRPSTLESRGVTSTLQYIGNTIYHDKLS